MWLPTVFGAMTRPGGDLLVRQATGGEAQDIDLASGETGDVAPPAGDAMTGCGEDRVDGFGIEAPGAGVAAQLCGGLAGGTGGPVWPWLEHGLVTVGGGQDAGRRGDGVASQSERVAGPVKTLALLAGHRPLLVRAAGTDAASAPRAAGRGGRVPIRRR